MTDIPVLGAADVAGLLDWVRLVETIAEGHRGPRPELGDTLLVRGGDALLSRSAWMDGFGVAVKSVTVLPENPARGRPAVQGAMIVFDDATGSVEAIIDSALVTRWKTAADSVLAARLLARPDAMRLLIVGAGAVAESLIDAYGAVFPGIACSIWARRQEQASALAERSGGTVNVAGGLPEAVAAADIVATATMAREPLIRGDWLRQGQHLDLIGAFTADMREADDEALRRGRLFVDSRETTIEHIGELRIPIANGVITPADVEGDLFDLVAGRAGRKGPEEITLFKNGGGAHLDLMTGRAILRAWRAAQG